MARSVSELLPRPFAELTLDDVRQIVANVGEERESLFFERKQRVTPATLAKSCAAFANTMGGLLLVGIADEEDELIGIEEQIAEPHVWVKDVLRGHLLPLPPFRARWLSLEGESDRGVLLVLVEESTSTPHLIARHGAIYVRNPGSSDPLPIQDQARLLELTARGERARERASKRANGALMRNNFDATISPVTLTLSPTGVADGFTTPLFGPNADLERLSCALGDQADALDDARRPFWTQHSAGIQRYLRHHMYPAFPNRLEGLEIWREGTLAILRGRIPWSHREEGQDDRVDHDLLTDEELAGQVRRFLDIGLELLLELGAHGDTALGLSLRAGQTIQWGVGGRHLEPGPVTVARWISLELNEDQRAAVIEQVMAEVARAVGVGPRGGGA
jgi:hypothetical protein